jgi:hypothetical protein
MARATYIYVVRWWSDLLMPFTVKHEAQSWIKQQQEQGKELPHAVVDVFHDGGHGWKRTLSLEEFMS